MKVNINGKEYEAREVPFEVTKEGWNEYMLRGAKHLRLKTTLLKIFEVVDETGKPLLQPDGSPTYLLNHRTDSVAGSEET